jgi:acetyl esterase
MGKSLYPDYMDGQLDEQVKAFLMELAKHESVPLRLQTPQEVRAGSSIRDWTRMRCSPSRATDLSIAGKGPDIPLRIYSPRGVGPYPVLVYFHGGGWVFGSLDEADHICSFFSNAIPAVVVSVDYRLSPEYKYPCALEDASSSLLWVEKEIAQYKGDPDRIGVAGESAGANIATVACQLLRDRPKICFQLLICPVTDLMHLDTESYRLFGDGPWLSKANIEYYYDQYLQNREQAREHLVSPLLSDDLSGLPPAHIITAEFDVLRDEGEAYAKRLLEAGNAVTHKMYKGMIHSFIVLNSMLDKADEALDDCVSLLRSNL